MEGTISVACDNPEAEHGRMASGGGTSCCFRFVFVVISDFRLITVSFSLFSMLDGPVGTSWADEGGNWADQIDPNDVPSTAHTHSAAGQHHKARNDSQRFGHLCFCLLVCLFIGKNKRVCEGLLPKKIYCFDEFPLETVVIWTLLSSFLFEFHSNTRENRPRREDQPQLPVPDQPPFVAYLGNIKYDATNDEAYQFFDSAGCHVSVFFASPFHLESSKCNHL